MIDNTDIEQQIKYAEKLKLSVEFQEEIENLKVRTQAMRQQYLDKIHGLPQIDDKYQGEINAEGKYEGIGKYTYQNGEVHIGQFKNGNRHGLGIYTFLNGDTYQGEYKDGWANGLGREIFASGASMAAVYHDNNSNGIGVYYYATGQKLIGQFIQNSFHGEGYLIYPDGTWKKQIYDNGYTQDDD